MSKIYVCEKCDKEYKSKGALYNHKRSVHDKITYACNQCDYKCSMKGHLNQHVKQVHLKIKDFKCDLCDYKCSRKESLKTHVKTCTGSLKCSSGEKAIMDVLDEFKIQYIYDQPFGNLYGVSGTKQLRWDFRIPLADDKQLMIEYNGIQHYMPVCFAGICYDKAEDRFEIQKEHDERKNVYCSINDYKLLRISCFEDKYLRSMVIKFIKRYSDLLKAPIQPKPIIATDVIINVQKSKIPVSEKIKLFLKLIT